MTETLGIMAKDIIAGLKNSRAEDLDAVLALIPKGDAQSILFLLDSPVGPPLAYLVQGMYIKGATRALKLSLETFKNEQAREAAECSAESNQGDQSPSRLDGQG